MDLEEIKLLMEEANKEALRASEEFSERSPTHRAALQIMDFVKDLHHGDSGQTRHLQRIKQIIEDHMEDINNEDN